MRKVISYLLPIFLIILLVPALLFACKETKEVGTFDLNIAGAVLSWDAVEGADHYVIDCTTPDGGGYTIDVKSTTFTAPQTAYGDYLYIAYACDASGNLLARSEPILYHLGQGGYSDPILISSVAELQALKTGSVSVTFGKKTVSAPLYYRLNADLDFTGVEKLTPIGTNSDPFRGYFDGNGHTISNLSYTTSTEGRAGLFGMLSGATVKNLTLQNASIILGTKSNVSGSGLEYGLLAAYSKDSVIDNCHVTGNIEFMLNVNTTGSSTADIGGIVGSLTGGKILSSSFTGTIDARYSQVFVGGIVGYAMSGTQHFVMANCLSDATVKGAATGYDLNQTKSTAKARIGVLIGSVSGAEKLVMNVAVGTATATAAGDAATGTPLTSLTSGVFGNTSQENDISTMNSVPMIDIFYSADTISAVSGTRLNLGTGNTAYGLTAAELKDTAKYIIGDSSALDFEGIWAMGDTHPVLRGAGQTVSHDDVTLAIKSETQDVTYTFSLLETLLPKYYSLTIGTEKKHYVGYHLNDVLSSDLNLTLEGAKEVVISADGIEDIRLAVNKTAATFVSTYLFFGTYNTTYSRLPESYDGVRIIDASNPNVPYLITGDTITVTIVKADETPAA